MKTKPNAAAVAERRVAPRMSPAFGTTIRFDRAHSPDAQPHGLVWNLSRGEALHRLEGRGPKAGRRVPLPAPLRARRLPVRVPEVLLGEKADGAAREAVSTGARLR